MCTARPFARSAVLADGALEPTVWLLVVLVLAAVVGLAYLALAVGRLREIERAAAKLDALEGLRRAAERLAEEQGAIDLRRIERALIDVRDGLKRLEERMFAVVESASARSDGPHPAAPAGLPAGAALAERAIARLVALGFERVQIVTPLADLEALAGSESAGEIVVEARRSGAPHKGRLIVRSGVISDVQLQSVYAIFP